MILNNYSEKLRDQALDYLKKKKKVIYEIEGKRIIDGYLACKSLARMLSKDTIYDPDQDKNVDIAYIKSYQPAPADSDRDSLPVFGDIIFAKANHGLIIVNWNNPADRDLHLFLYFCRWNKSNIGKPWHIKPVKYFFDVRDEEEEARKQIEKGASIARAETLLYDLSDAEIFRLHEGLFPGHKVAGGFNTVRLKLIGEAKRNPETILHLHEDEKLEIMQLIKDLEKAGTVFYDSKTRTWRRKDGESQVCKAGEKEDRYDVFYRTLKIDNSLKREMKTYLLSEMEVRATSSPQPLQDAH